MFRKEPRIPRGHVRDGLVIAYLAVQLALPVRGLFLDKLETRGNFSWNMYSQRYECDARYFQLMSDGRSVRINADALVRGGRLGSVCHRDRLPRFHAWLCREARRRDPGSTVRGGVRASHNLGAFRRMVDTATDICADDSYGIRR